MIIFVWLAFQDVSKWGCCHTDVLIYEYSQLSSNNSYIKDIWTGKNTYCQLMSAFPWCYILHGYIVSYESILNELIDTRHKGVTLMTIALWWFKVCVWTQRQGLWPPWIGIEPCYPWYWENSELFHIKSNSVSPEDKFLCFYCIYLPVLVLLEDYFA